MRSLYLALIRQKDHLALVLAVVFSSGLILSNESRDVQILRAKANDIFTVIYSPVAWMRSMAVLEEEADLLRQKNLQLTLQVETMLLLADENRELRGLLDFERESKLVLHPAKVINKGISPNMVSMSIDVGSVAGITGNNAVITPRGVVGKTILVGENSSVVQMISDHNFRISVRMLPGGYTGILRWLKDDLCEIREVQKNAVVKVGDKVISSGFSDIFPKNLPIGEVVGIRDERASFQRIVTVKIYDDLGSLVNVFVVSKIEYDLD